MKIELSDKEIDFLVRALVCNYGEKETDYEKDISNSGLSYELIGKFIFASNASSDIFYQARREEVCKDKTHKTAFMGHGWLSKIFTNLLHKRLHFAFHQLGMMEQNGGMGTDFDEKMQQECTQNIKDVLNDLIFAFGMTPQNLMDDK